MSEINEKKSSGRGLDMAAMSGVEDIVFDDDLTDADEEAADDETDEEEYNRWLEESLKESKGYGQKVSYEGEIPKSDGSWYDNSTYAAYDKQMAEAQAQIRALRERDAKIQAREDFIHDMLPKWRNGYSGDPNHFIAQFVSIAWYGITALAGAGISFAAGQRGVDMIPLAGLGGVIGAIIRYNGKEGYSLSDSMQRGAAEIGLFAAALVIGVWSFFAHIDYKIILILAAAGGAAGVFMRERVFLVRPMSETVFKMLPYVLAPPAIIGVYILLKLCGFVT